MFESFKVKRRLSEVEERLEKLERAQKQVGLEWEDAYEKFTRIVQRITKRAQVVAAAETEEEAAVEDESEAGATGLVLNERQRKLQSQILTARRRNGLLPG